MNELECPICEFSFGWDTASGLEVTCPCCGKNFSVTAEQLTVQSTGSALRFPDPSRAKPTVVPAQDAAPEVSQTPPTTAVVDLDDAGGRMKRFHQQRKRRRRRIWITLFLLLLSCGTTGFLAHRMGFWNFAPTEKVDSAEDESQTDGGLISDSDKPAKLKDSVQEVGPTSEVNDG